MSIKRVIFPNFTQIVPYVLLLINGCLIALMLVLAKQATDQGVSAITYAFWQTLGAGLVLTYFSKPSMMFKQNASVTRYFLISGATGVAIPNVTAFLIVGEIGSGFTATLYAFPPIFTFLIAVVVRLQSFNFICLIGISLAGIGCFCIVWAQYDVVSLDVLQWYLLGFIVPVSLAIGNVYRSLYWPRHLSPMPLAAGMLMGASLLLGVFSLLTGLSVFEEVFRYDNLFLVLSQILVTALTYLGLFSLQKHSSPVFLSQMGSVAAIAGLGAGVLFFEKQYSDLVWISVVAILIGLSINSFANSQSKVEGRVAGQTK